MMNWSSDVQWLQTIFTRIFIVISIKVLNNTKLNILGSN